MNGPDLFLHYFSICAVKMAHMTWCFYFNDWFCLLYIYTHIILGKGMAKRRGMEWRWEEMNKHILWIIETFCSIWSAVLNKNMLIWDLSIRSPRHMLSKAPLYKFCYHPPHEYLLSVFPVKIHEAEATFYSL